MKNLIVIGVNTRGIRTTKTVKTSNIAEITTNPKKFDFAKVSAVMTEQSFNQALGMK
ncbi:hypothetical protein [Salmonella phage SP-3]|uniref:Uncharacterized protein n=1 Tax=Salmonella phage SP-3 TaxID=1186124 RepID=A0A2H4PIG8_9CAUD|nr:hypothetical protein HOT55_gp078 [Salmonella phage SP3]ATW62599.1 hypothetical protein [Salmonella phage SP3]